MLPCSRTIGMHYCARIFSPFDMHIHVVIIYISSYLVSCGLGYNTGIELLPNTYKSLGLTPHKHKRKKLFGVPTQGKLRQKNHELTSSLDYIAMLGLRQIYLAFV